MEAFAEKALESFCVDGSASCSHEGHELRFQETLQQKWSLWRLKGSERKWQRAPISSARFIRHSVLIGGVLYMILNRPQRRRREWDTERKNSVTQTLRCMNSPCRQHAVNTDSPTGLRGTLCLRPLFPDAHWSVTTSGGVCELTPLSQGKLTLCAA